MKRMLKLILIFIIIISIFGFGSILNAKPLTIWVSWEGTEKFNEIAKAFEDKTGINAKMVHVPKIYQKIEMVAKGGGELPDIAIVRESYIGELAEENIIKPLPQTMFGWESPTGKMAFSYKDKIFGLPFYFDAQVVYYNPKLLKTAGLSDPSPSWDLNDLEKYGKALKKLKGITPLGWGAYSPYFFGGFEYSFIKDCIKCQRNKFFTSATEKAVLYYKKLIKEGIGVSMDRNAFLAGFKEGKIGFIIFGTFILPEFIKEKLDFGLVPLPINPETKKRVASYLDYKGFVVFDTPGEKVRKFLSFVAGKDIQFTFCNPLYKFPANKEALKDILTKNPYLSHLKETVETGIIPPKDPIYLYYNRALPNVLKLILEKNVPIDKAFSAGRKYLKGKEK